MIITASSGTDLVSFRRKTLKNPPGIFEKGLENLEKSGIFIVELC